MIIGIIGKIGSGKSACLRFIKENYSKFSVETFSCDQIAKEIILSDKKKYDFNISNLTDFFNDEELQEKVRKVLHPAVFDKIKTMIEESNKNNNQIFIIESALPNEQMYDMCDKIICIKSPYKNILERLITARNFTYKQAYDIHSSQSYYEKFYDKADYIIINDGSRNDFLKKIKEVMDEICIICK